MLSQTLELITFSHTIFALPFALGAMLVAASGAWRDALYVTGGAALLGIVFGLLIRRRETAQRV